MLRVTHPASLRSAPLSRAGRGRYSHNRALKACSSLLADHSRGKRAFRKTAFTRWIAALARRTKHSRQKSIVNTYPCQLSRGDFSRLATTVNIPLLRGVPRRGGVCQPAFEEATVFRTKMPYLSMENPAAINLLKPRKRSFPRPSRGASLTLKHQCLSI